MDTLVYVQALPISLPSSAKKFEDLNTAEFELSNSSKIALQIAQSIPSNRITVIGHASVLRESLARGADDAIAAPLCDSPIAQANYFPKSGYSRIFLGENVDAQFTGACLAGVLCQSRGFTFHITEDFQKRSDFPENSVVLVSSSGMLYSNINVRRINQAFQKDLDLSKAAVVGSSRVSRTEFTLKSEVQRGTMDELSVLISKKLRRMQVQV